MMIWRELALKDLNLKEVNDCIKKNSIKINQSPIDQLL